MDYREFPPPPHLQHFVKLGWTLEVPDDGPAWVTHVATPDGCMEIIRRLEGRSRWDGDQPEAFVAGIITRPTALELGRGSRFVGIRIWPWTWPALTGRSPAELTDRWAGVSEVSPDLVLPASLDGLFQLAARAVPAPRADLIAALLACGTPGELSARTGLSPRNLQRWFERNVGQPPRLWLRLLRFGDAFAELPAAHASLAEHALDHGYADQAHMARDFKLLAGAPARRARRHARGPFLSPT